MTGSGRRLLACAALAVGFALLVPTSALAQKKLLRLRFDGLVTEAPQPDLGLGALFGGEKSKSLYEWTKLLGKAAKDKSIDGIVMLVEEPRMSLAQLEELSRALRGVREGGKKIYCYLDVGNNLTYALAAQADYVALAENSDLFITGLNAEMTFYKGLLDKIGVEADMMHCGAYKSALEPFTRTEPSKEAAENVNWLLDGIYERWIGLIAQGRKLSPEQVKAAVDQAPLGSQKALELKLIDAVTSFGAFKQMLHKDFGKDVEVLKKYGGKGALDLDLQSSPFELFHQLQELFTGGDEDKARKAGLGLIYIDGAISVGRAEPGMFGGSSSAGSTTIRAAFEKARADDQIKAVVVRVDSPGGSATASDIIWEAARACAKEKPVIVSMGGVAGSGGYYVALPGDTIFAEDSTITGSIGVVGGKLVWNGLMVDKLGVTTTEFQRGKNAGLFSMNQKWTEPQRAKMTDYMNAVYTQFKGRVKTSRGDRIKGDLETLAGGRVYTGKQALEHGLIDKLGGLTDALAFAAAKVDLKDYEVYVLPKPPDFAEILKKLMGSETEDEWEIGLPNTYQSDPLLRAALPLLQGLAPDQLGRIGAGLQRAMILNREHVGCFVPFVLDIR